MIFKPSNRYDYQIYTCPMLLKFQISPELERLQTLGIIVNSECESVTVGHLKPKPLSVVDEETGTAGVEAVIELDAIV